jgi:hypothetical protein
MSRIEPVPPDPDGNPVTNSLLARVMGRCPSVRRATACTVGCNYCSSLGPPVGDDADARTKLAVAFAELVAEDPSAITDEQFDVLREEFNEEEIVELVAFICLVGIAGQMFGAVMGLEAADAEEAAGYQLMLARQSGKRGL